MTHTPRDYGDIDAEWAALDGGAGMAWLGRQRTIVVRGEDRVEFLQGQLSNDIAALEDTRGCAAAALTVQGRVSAIVAVYRVGDVFEVVVEQDNLEHCRERLGQFLVAEDVELELGPVVSTLSLAGPRTKTVLAAAGVETQSWPPWYRGEAQIDGHTVSLRARGDELRVPLIEIDISEDGAPSLWQRLLDCGARPCGFAAWEVLRIESGRAAYGRDVDESRIAIEARLDWAIHFSKGFYVGQEVIERAVSRGRINHRLSLVATGEPVEIGARVEGGAERDVVTSTACSPRQGNLCLAYVDAARAEDCAEIAIECSAAAVAGRILEWPRQRRS